MSLRTRILLASALVLMIPLAVLSLGIRGEIARRVSDQYMQRVEALAAVIEDDLARRTRDLGERLAALRQEIAADNRLRLALLGGDPREKSYLLDYAGRAMRVMGLSMLQIQDAGGRIVSSGHFRNEYDRLEPTLAPLLVAAPQGTALVEARRPDGSFLALARIDSLSLGGKRYHLIGGFAVDRPLLAALAPDRNLAVSLLHPGGALSSDPAIEKLLAALPPAAAARAAPELLAGDFLFRAVDLPVATMATVVTGAAPEERTPAGAGTDPRRAWIVASHSRAPLREIVGSLDRWFLLVLAATAAGSFVLALALSVGISHPIRGLARKAAGIDLDHLDVDFASNRTDEVGILSRFLAAMTRRLERNRAELREAEHRAAVGEVARQVNHDLRNGVAPIQNVLRHLGQVAHESPGDLRRVFLDRQATLESGIAYLEDLAANYARLSTPPRREPVHLNDIVRQVAPPGWPAGSGVTVQLELGGDLPPLLGDPTAIRRIVENLVRNACESLGDGSGTVTIRTGTGAGPAGEPCVVLAVADTGPGIRPEELERIFDRFITTKPGGTGLGLPIVQRLVSDHGGSVHAESTPGRGAVFTVTLPARDAAR